MYRSERPHYPAPPRPPAPRAPIFKRMRRRGLAVVILALLATVVLLVFFFMNNQEAKQSQSAQTGQDQNGGTAKMADNFGKARYSTTRASSIWVVVNKPLALDPKEYQPADLVMPAVPLRVPGNESMQLRHEAAMALEALVAGAKTADLNLMLASGYRSYAYQVNLYGGYVRSIGQAAADQTSARPGHSEHQTGLAADIEPATRDCELDTCFGDLPEGKWLAANAHRFGFIIRYPKDKAAVTGYEYEPWHVRYVGKELAAELHRSGQTMEEFFDTKRGSKFN